MINKRAQQEILGFVLIVMIIIVVGVVFLGISLRKSPTLDTEDLEIGNFLSVGLKYTSDCVLTEPLPADMKEVVSGCYSNKQCVDGRETCEVLETVFSGILNAPSPLKAGADNVNKYNKVLVYYQGDLDDPSTKNRIREFELGNLSSCVQTRAGRYIIPKSPGSLIVELTTCS